MGTVNILQAIREVNSVKAGVMITTDKVYDNDEKNHFYKETDKLGGHDPYSSSKAAAEIAIASYIKSFFNPTDYNKKHKTLIASARAGNVIGGGDWSNDRLVPDIIKGIFQNKEIIIRNPDAIRPWQYILEPLYGYLLLATKLYEGNKELAGAWNFGPDNKSYITVKELVKKSMKTLGKGSYKIIKNSDKHEAQQLKLNSDKAKKLLKWEPVLNLEETFRLTFNWYNNFYNKKNIINLTNEQIDFFFNKTKTI
jgi:CDP-glucose 4,6-dehydratase